MSPSSRINVLLATLVVASLTVAFLPPTWQAPMGTWLAPAVALTIAGLVLEFLEVPTPRNGTLSVSGVAHVAIILIVPPPWSGIAVGMSVLAHQSWRRRPPQRLIFNVTNHVLTVLLASQIVGLVGDPPVLLRDEPIPLGYLAAALAALLYYGINVTLTAVVIATATQRRLDYVLVVNNRSTLLPDLAAQTLGILIAASWYAMPAWVLLLGVPTAVITRTLQMIRRLERETIEAVETLADSIDERDEGTFRHSARVAEYATSLAVAMDVEDRLNDVIGLAARVHDLGKMGISNHILLKPGPLERDEAEDMRRHPVIGARILARYQLYRDGAALVRAHHEQWDGHGYPDGLRGTDIPLGARIIAVADTFDAMTSDRPYRAGLAPEVALAELRAGAGANWDPVVVGHFLRLFDDPNGELPDTDAVRRYRTRQAASDAADGSPARPPVTPTPRGAVVPTA